MRKWIRKWYKKLCVGLAASAAIERNKSTWVVRGPKTMVAVAAITVAATSVKAQDYRHGGPNAEPQTSAYYGTTSPLARWLLEYSDLLKAIFGNHDNTPAGQMPDTSSIVQAPNGPQGSARENPLLGSANP